MQLRPHQHPFFSPPLPPRCPGVPLSKPCVTEPEEGLFHCTWPETPSSLLTQSRDLEHWNLHRHNWLQRKRKEVQYTKTSLRKQDAFSAAFRLHPFCLFTSFWWQADYNLIVTFLPWTKIKKNPQPNNENTVKLQEKYLLQHQPNTIPHTHSLGKNHIQMQTSCLVHSVPFVCWNLEPGLQYQF